MTTANLPSSPSLSDLRRALLTRLEKFPAQVPKHLVLEGLARWLADLVGIALLSFILDRLLRLSLPMRLIFLFIGVGFLIVEAWRFILSPLFVKLGLVGLAAAIDRTGSENIRGSLAGRVASVLELPELLKGRTAPSEAMVQSAVIRCHETLNNVKFEQHLNETRRRLSIAAIAALLIVPLAIASFNHRSTDIWFRRYFLGSNIPWPQKTYLNVHDLQDGKIIVAKAEPFVLRVSSREGSVPPETVALRYREGSNSRTTVAMTRFGIGDFRYDFPPLAADAEVEITGNDDVVSFNVEPIDRPKITELLLISQHPTEEKATTHNFAGQDADLSFLARTKLELQFTSNVPVTNANLRSNLTKPGAGDLKRLSDRKFSLPWTHEAPVQLQIELLGASANLTSLPTPVAVGLKIDLPPRVSLTFSSVRNRVTPQARIPLAIQARDD